MTTDKFFSREGACIFYKKYATSWIISEWKRKLSCDRIMCRQLQGIKCMIPDGQTTAYIAYTRVTLRDANRSAKRRMCSGQTRSTANTTTTATTATTRRTTTRTRTRSATNASIKRPQAISSNIKRSKKHATTATKQQSNQPSRIHRTPPFPKPPEEFPRWAIKTWVFLDPNPKVLWRSTWRKGQLTSVAFRLEKMNCLKTWK